MGEVRLREGETLEDALRRFKRKVLQEGIIQKVKRRAFYLKPGQKRRSRCWPLSGTEKNHAGTSNDGGNHPPREMVAMQRFIAELSKLVDKSEFERSW